MSDLQLPSLPSFLDGQELDLLDAIERSRIGALVRDERNDILFANSSLLTWLQYAESDLQGKPTTFLVPEELHASVEAEREAIQRGDTRPRLGILLRKDSTTFPALLLPQPRRIRSEKLEDQRTISTVGITLVLNLSSVQTPRLLAEVPTPLGPALNRVGMELQFLSMSAPSSLAAALENPLLSELTPREKQILELLMTGERGPEIAERLFLSAHTVRNHLKRIYRKTGANSQTELIRFVRKL